MSVDIVLEIGLALNAMSPSMEAEVRYQAQWQDPVAAAEMPQQTSVQQTWPNYPAR